MGKLLILAAVVCLGLGSQARTRAPRVSLGSRIIGGNTATIENFPYQLSLQLRTINVHICGASIIGHSWAISAVQCTRGYMPSLLGLRAGSSLHQSGGTVHSVAQLIEHPLYDDFTNENDIALLRVNEPFVFGVGVQAVPLAAAGSEVSPGTYAVAAGWGETVNDGGFVSQLRQVSLPVVSSVLCNQAYWGAITSNMICAGYLEGGVASCQPELIAKKGYPAETHSVTTEDGYILTLHRIPYGKSGPSNNRPAVFVQHGLLCSSDAWVIMEPEKSLAFILADAGYDVWLGNTRGSTYSKEHVSLQSTDNEFWDFSWHESGVYDLPAMIDYVLSTTSQSNLYYIGHSMGTTMFYVMASMRPEYNAKIRAQFSLAPVAFMSNLKSPVIRLMSTFEDTLEILMKMIGMHEFLPNSEFLTLVGGVFCNDDAITQQLCDNILFLLCGYDQDQLNTTALPVLLGHIPAGASTNQMVHYAQGVNSAKFRQFSYGLIKNLATYGSLTPPDYDLSKITAPVFLHWSDNDLMADPKDVRELNGKLPNVKGSIRVPYAAFNHLDYMWAIDGKTLVYDTVLENMKKY